MSEMESTNAADVAAFLESMPTWAPRMTEPRVHVREGSGHREIIVDSVDADGDALATLREAVAAWLARGQRFDSAETLPREPGSKLRKTRPAHRTMVEGDLVEVSLHRHEVTGRNKGRLRAAGPYVWLLTDGGRIYRFTVQGEPLATCGICDQSWDRLDEKWRRPDGEIVTAHRSCTKREMRAREAEHSRALIGGRP